ncbi:hypothetical protein ACFOU2_20360 [Bacillus songklensis]|uniref:Uncharacterized protein n=1 Tax=Bacillus songklensis TaxID=1069116 RepID=A0ABV8B912_9BACI
MKAQKKNEQLEMTLSKEEYLHLAELVFLGKWVTNTFYEHAPEQNPYNEMEQAILNMSQHFNLDEIFDRYEANSFFNQKVEDRLMTVVDSYDTDAFWMKFASLLAQRDVQQEMKSVNGLSKNPLERLVEKEMEYEQEFAENGLRNVQVISK